MNAPFRSSPTAVASRWQLTLNDEDGEGNTTRVIDLTVSSSHRHDTHAATDFLARLADLPTKAALQFGAALTALDRGDRETLREALIEGMRLAVLARDAGELEGL